MQQITLDNFRVFGSEAAFDLAPVTVLTGKNNSGKSSLIKAFLVLADYLEQDDHTVLRLDGRRAGKHKISTYQTLQNWHGESSNTVKISYTHSNCKFEYYFDKDIDATRASLVDFRATLLNEAETLTVKRQARGKLLVATVESIEEEPLTDYGASEGNGGPTYLVTVSQNFIDVLTASGLRREPTLQKENLQSQKQEAQQSLAEVEAQLATLEKQKLQPLGQKLQYQLLITERQGLQRKIDQIQSALVTPKAKSGVIFRQEVTVNERNMGGHTISALITQALYAYEDKAKTGAEVTGIFHSDVSGRHTMFRFQQALQRLMRFATFHVGANRTYQAPLIFNQHQGSELASIVAPFLSSGFIKRGRAEAFLKYWLPRFDIGEAVKVEPVEGVAFKVLVQQGKLWINLVDLGYGAGQILTVLLQIASIIQQREARQFVDRVAVTGPVIVLIEEPESNLHPELQSRLALLFVEPEPYLGPRQVPEGPRRPRLGQPFALQFVVETHSEYLIRKLQNLVADRNQLANELLIYYLDRTGNKRINILTDGKLSEEFGSGFFDKADEEAMELYRKQKRAAREKAQIVAS